MQIGEYSAAVESGQINLACFEVAGRLYALDVSQVRLGAEHSHCARHFLWRCGTCIANERHG